MESSTEAAILVTEPKRRVALVTLNRPHSLNALSSDLLNQLKTALEALDASSSISVIILVGSHKAFAAGLDISEMMSLIKSKEKAPSLGGFVNDIKTPLIAAVSGYAIGGGLELAMMCDILYCTDTAKLGLPEITLSSTPGGGGSQRLSRAIGKSRTMELMLTGKTFSGKEAFAWGLAARTFPDYESLMNEALKTAETIGTYHKESIYAMKDLVNKSQEVGLSEGISYEQSLFQKLLGNEEQKKRIGDFLARPKNNRQ
ncbi:hypothetical protein VTL71DRAFT_9524 [Oculimacula yallundae]|uniref:Enoyl-CoA hydratase n=1 Tax=Oculimacula yallundae TaxID=86028 RepID=A0ABR4BS58_9HELO